MRSWKIWSLATLCKQLTSFYPILVLLSVMVTVLAGVPYQLPVYSETPTNVTFYKGVRAILQCSVKHLGTKQIIWKKTTNEHVLTFGNMVFVDDPDISVDHMPHRDEWNLVISNVQPHHAGVYECQISTKEDLRKYVQLNVLDEAVPRLVAIKIGGKSYVEKGEKIVLTCNATGELYPPEDIDWFLDGQKIKQNQLRGITIAKFRVAETKTLHSQLEIDHSEMSDGGNYICRSSDLEITNKHVMVLNGVNPNIKPRSQDEQYITQDTSSKAETNHSKRDSNSPSQLSGAACTLSSLFYNGRFSSCALTFLVLVVTITNIYHRQ
ncbi:uncharacterized protein LOC127879787 isoform X2 [Dreissena polymorpha]|uniref:uncharacterized protein LOC127879787 isoform X2 n=1 Tax=Dreissena polymorpha TaxID=45954 RepID=UPI00226555AF|nr:uncharacterized protein LOC127879787 isoform X2 [Dreissena polymorpha]